MFEWWSVEAPGMRSILAHIMSRPEGKAGSNLNSDGDAEMQPWEVSATSDAHDGLWQEALSSHFHMPASQLRQWPGVVAYARYLHRSFQVLVSDEYRSLWCGTNCPRSAMDCWPWFQSVTETCARLQQEDSSIEDVCRALHRQTSAEQVPTVHAISVFAVLCWSTMVLNPRLVDICGAGEPSLMVQQQKTDQVGVRIDSVCRPIPAIFRHFQRVMQMSRWRAPVGEGKASDSTALYVSVLNYEPLFTIAKIQLVWVDNLTDHLDFDAANRRLSIFKYPTFCALSAMAESTTPPILLGVFRALYGVEAKDSVSAVQVHQEVLMSYRVLFGQTSRSRALAVREIRRLQDNDATDHDRLLDILCGLPCDRRVRALPASIWPVTCRGYAGELQEQSAYSSQDDFPMFGRRLAKLQEFSERQQPSRLRDLWRDRRNLLQWYLFWGGLIVGGLTIAIAILQFLVAVVQLFIAIYVQQGCACPPSTTPAA